jgi:hypothetical protein
MNPLSDRISEPLQFEQMVFTSEASAVIRLLREFECVLNGEHSSESLSILGETPARFTDEERGDFALMLDTIDDLSCVIDPALYKVIRREPFREVFQRFLTTLVPGETPENTTLRLWEFLEEMHQGSSLEDQWVFDTILKDIDGLGRQFTSLFTLYVATVCARDMVVEKLGDGSQVATFLTEERGYRITGVFEGVRLRLDTGTLVTLNAK